MNTSHVVPIQYIKKQTMVLVIGCEVHKAAISSYSTDLTNHGRWSKQTTGLKHISTISEASERETLLKGTSGIP